MGYRPIGRWSSNLNHMLRLLNVASTTRFLREIGCLSRRKQTVPQPQNHPQAARYDHIPLSRDTVDRLAPANDNLRKALLLTLARHGTASRHAVQALYDRNHDPELHHLLSFFYDKFSKVETTEPQPTYALTGVKDMRYLANGFTCLAS